MTETLFDPAPRTQPLLKPTSEQQECIDAFRTGGHLIIEAGAGTGKTTTLKSLARTTQAQGIYIAFNKSVATEAAQSFPRECYAATAHSMAFRLVGRQFAHRLNGPRMPGREVAARLGIHTPYRISETMMLAPHQVARIVMETVTRYCYSADPVPHRGHLPVITGVDNDQSRQALADIVVPLAVKAWADLTSVNGQLKYAHDHYLKLWQLSSPKLPCDYVLLDEAQDSNPVVSAIFNGQTHAQRVLVGDSNQSIYGWRGAENAIAQFRADHHLFLSQSFRFGEAIAGEANKWLRLLGSRLTLTGSPAMNSRIERLDQADAVLCRTNAAAVQQLLDHHTRGIPVALVGGGKDIRTMAEAAITLKAGTGTWHPELCMFQTWAQVQDYVDYDAGGSDLAVFVKLIDEHGPETVIEAVDKAVPENLARVTVSTAHKAKGREWGTVRVADDFTGGKPKADPAARDQSDGLPTRPTMMLAYVTVTRARTVLDRTGLAWVDDLRPPAAAQQPAPAAIGGAQ